MCFVYIYIVTCNVETQLPSNNPTAGRLKPPMIRPIAASLKFEIHTHQGHGQDEDLRHDVWGQFYFFFMSWQYYDPYIYIYVNIYIC